MWVLTTDKQRVNIAQAQRVRVSVGSEDQRRKRLYIKAFFSDKTVETLVDVEVTGEDDPKIAIYQGAIDAALEEIGLLDLSVEPRRSNSELRVV
jgi:hypothetical protein